MTRERKHAMAAENESDALTPKQEQFCQAYIETGNASEAYRQAYGAKGMKPATVWREAKKLLDNPKVSPRIAELQSGHRERHNMTVDGITTELEEARALAMKNKQPGAAVQASMGKAKLHGLLVDRSEHSGKDGGPIMLWGSNELSDVERAVRVEAVLERARQARDRQGADGLSKGLQGGNDGIAK
jgi:phage terminase small subunit